MKSKLYFSSQMEYFNFEDLVGDLKNLNEEQKYWMVRTMGGAYYGEFIRGIYNRLLLNILYVINQKYGLNL